MYYIAGKRSSAVFYYNIIIVIIGIIIKPAVPSWPVAATIYCRQQRTWSQSCSTLDILFPGILPSSVGRNRGLAASGTCASLVRCTAKTCKFFRLLKPLNYLYDFILYKCQRHVI